MPGAGNININPLFCMPDSLIFTLASNSPCIGTGKDGKNIGALGIGCSSISDVGNNSTLKIVNAYELFSNFPNPFNPQTTINYRLANKSLVKLIISDILGREVEVLDIGKKFPGGHKAVWDTKKFPSGIYLCRLITEREVKTIKMILTR
jgi:hypothetical protein